MEGEPNDMRKAIVSAQVLPDVLAGNYPYICNQHDL
jgi:hypothetical protein